MQSVTSYQLLALAAVLFITVFCGWGYSTSTVSAWSVAGVESADNIVWD
jgi:hypothetical protein